MTHAKQKGYKAKQIVALFIALAIILPFIPVTTYADAPNVGTFQNLSGGENVISLALAQSFEATIEVDGDFDPADVTWSLLRDTGKTYVDPIQFPVQYSGAELEDWKNGKNEAFFTNITASLADGELTLNFGNTCYFYDRSGNPDYSVPHSNGGSFLDVCGYFDLTATLDDGTELGTVPIKIVPYESYRTMGDIYIELDEIVAFAENNTNLYVEKFSMGVSSGEIYEALDMPYIIIAKDKAAVTDWLHLTEAAESDPAAILADIESGNYDNVKVPVLYSNVHANETAAVDGIMNFAWLLLNAAAGDGELEYNKLTGFTTQGEAQLVSELAADKVITPELVADDATYLGYLKDGNKVSGIVDLDEYYEQENITLSLDEMLDDVFFILVPEENVEGRTYNTRTASNGYDLNRDNSFQTTEETQNMQKLIGTFKPVSLTEFHGRVQTFQCEPCSPPHEPNFEYDLLAEHLMGGGEALGIAAVANNDKYNSYVIPQRDYLTGDSAEIAEWDPWDDMSTSYTPQFAMLHGTVAYTVELPAYNDSAADLVMYGCLGQSDYIAANKLDYLENQVAIFARGVGNQNSNSLVDEWFCDQNDNEGAEARLFRPVYDGENQNGNFYPEAYIVPLDGINQKNLDAASQMMEWLSRNDVKIMVTEGGFTYNGVTYPKGTMVVTMYQAKRSVANSALYSGTFIENWSSLYSEGITSFADTRGFTMATVTEAAEYAAIAEVCGGFMDYEACLAHIGKMTSGFGGTTGAYVIIKNASEASTAAVADLLKNGYTVGMVTDSDSQYYGSFVVSYSSWNAVKGDYLLTGIGLSAANVPSAKVIAKAPLIYIAGSNIADNTSGFVRTSQVTNANWNYDRIATEYMGLETTKNLSSATLIIGASALNDTEKSAVKGGTPYIGYGAAATRSNTVLGNMVTRAAASGMDCLGYVTYPETTLTNASYVLEGDDVLYGYGVGYFAAIPEGAKVLTKMDGGKTPMEGFVRAKTDGEKASSAAYLDGSIQGFSYEGEDDTGNSVNVTMFANSLTHKGHQRDEYAYISNLAFASLLGSDFIADTGTTGGDDGGGATIKKPEVPLADANPFGDIEGHWAQGEILEMYKGGYMQGIGNTTFSPNTQMTRGMFVTILWRIEGKPSAKDECGFTDLTQDWYVEAVAWASENGVVLGHSDDIFAPDDNIKRQEIAAILYRYAGVKGLALDAEGDLDVFVDTDDISAYAVDAITWAVGAEIIKGDGNNIYPQNNTTRAEGAAMLIRYLSFAK